MKRFQITFKGQVYELDVEEISTTTSGVKKTASAPTPAPTLVPPSPVVPATNLAPKAAFIATPAGAQSVIAPIPGKILEVNVKVGDSIKRGDIICILEAMKMQNEIMAAQDGTVSDVRATVGQVMSTGDVIIVIS
ncbi:MAG: biotin/lipoyl attachment protein [Firmicutes bacterium]|nr:biotin/lipoyl attachment protein [Bacillota bacterium]